MILKKKKLHIFIKVKLYRFRTAIYQNRTLKKGTLFISN